MAIVAPCIKNASRQSKKSVRQSARMKYNVFLICNEKGEESTLRSSHMIRRYPMMLQRLLPRNAFPTANRTVLLTFSYVLALIFFSVQVLWAEEAETMKGKSKQILDTITVTANKIEEDIKDVPNSVTVIDGMLIEEKGMKSVSDVIKSIPNMNLGTYGVSTKVVANIRGLNTSLFTNNNPIVMYVDGVPYSDSVGFDLSLANIERIEVLRGPQGTLYAMDAIGGVINVVTKEPANEWSAKVGAEYGSFNYREFKFNTSGALQKDVLYLGLNGQYRADDGWQTNSFPGNEEDANKFEDLRLGSYLLYKPTEEFTARFTYSSDDVDAYGINGYGIAGTGVSFSDFNRDDAEDVITEFESKEELKVNSQALHLAYDFGNFTVASVTTRRDQEYEVLYDFDGGNDLVFTDAFSFDNQDRETWTQELTLKSNNTEGFRYVAGIYLDMSERKQGPFGVSGTAFGGTLNALSESDDQTYAVFGQVIYPVTDRLDLTLGARYQHIKKDFDLETLFDDFPIYTLKDERTWSELLPRAALNYKFNDKWSAYISYSKGYMPGGYNFFATSGTADDNSFEPQVSTNYEIGVKAQTERMILSAALFYMDIEDIHVYRFEGGGLVTLTDNAEKAHSMGAELEATYWLTDEFELSASVGLIKAEYDDYDAGDGGVYDGEKIEQTPDYTVNLGGAYYHPTGFYGRTDLNMTGETAFFSNTETFPEQDAYTTLDARIGYTADRWEIYAYGKNLTDEDYIIGYRGNALVSLASFNAPRTFGIGLRYEF